MAFETLDKLQKLSKEKGLLLPLSRAWLTRAQVDVLVGNNAGAIVDLDHLISSKNGDELSINLLRIDPFWDPLRKEPGFQALLDKYASQKPETELKRTKGGK